MQYTYSIIKTFYLDSLTKSSLTFRKIMTWDARVPIWMHRLLIVHLPLSVIPSYP